MVVMVYMCVVSRGGGGGGGGVSYVNIKYGMKPHNGKKLSKNYFQDFSHLKFHYQILTKPNVSKLTPSNSLNKVYQIYLPSQTSAN